MPKAHLMQTVHVIIEIISESVCQYIHTKIVLLITSSISGRGKRIGPEYICVGF